jgi:hypothetical protein
MMISYVLVAWVNGTQAYALPSGSQGTPCDGATPQGPDTSRTG